MPEEPNNPIEAELKTWAEERRRQAEPPFELHSADRRQLRDEVGRVYNTRAPQVLAPSLRSLWPRLALAAGICAVLVLAIVRFVQRDDGPAAEFARLEQKSGAELPSAADPADRATVPLPEAQPILEPDAPAAANLNVARQDQVEDSARAVAPTVASARPAELPMSQSAPAVRPPAAREELPPAALATAPAAEDAPALVSRSSSSTPERGASELMRRRYGLAPRSAPARDAFAGGPAAPVATAPVATVPAPVVQTQRTTLAETPPPTLTAAADSAVSEAAGAQPVPPMLSVQMSPAQRYRANLNSPRPVVLQSFRLEQTGKQVRVVDADGSVYEGRTLDLKAEDQALLLSPSQRKQLPAQTGRNTSVSSQAFQVSGSNQTMQSLVTFRGVITTTGGVRVQGQATVGSQLRQEVNSVSGGR